MDLLTIIFYAWAVVALFNAGLVALQDRTVIKCGYYKWRDWVIAGAVIVGGPLTWVLLLLLLFLACLKGFWKEGKKWRMSIND